MFKLGLLVAALGRGIKSVLNGEVVAGLPGSLGF